MIIRYSLGSTIEYMRLFKISFTRKCDIVLRDMVIVQLNPFYTTYFTFVSHTSQIKIIYDILCIHNGDANVLYSLLHIRPKLSW